VIRSGQVWKDGISVFGPPAGAQTAASDAKGFLDSVYADQQIQYPKFFKMDALSKLGFLGAEILLKDSFPKEALAPEDVGVVLSNSNSSLDTDIKYLKSVKDMASPALFVYTLPNIMIGEICIRHRFKGENSFFVFKTFDATFITGYVDLLLTDGLLKACICGWVELLGSSYDAALFLVGNDKRGPGLPFTTSNIAHIYALGPWIN
jgi:hypothetical protein